MDNNENNGIRRGRQGIPPELLEEEKIRLENEKNVMSGDLKRQIESIRNEKRNVSPSVNIPLQPEKRHEDLTGSISRNNTANSQNSFTQGMRTRPIRHAGQVQNTNHVTSSPRMPGANRPHTQTKNTEHHVHSAEKEYSGISYGNANQTYQSQNRTRHSVKKKSKKSVFPLVYIGLIVVLAIGMIVSLVYVKKSLEQYEASQTDNIAVASVEDMKEKCREKKYGEVFDIEKLKSENGFDDGTIASFANNIAGSDLICRENRKESEPTKKIYDVLDGEYKVGRIEMEHISQKTKLIIFTFDEWNVTKTETFPYSVSVTLPVGIGLKNGETEVEGTPDENGTNKTYNVCSVSKPSITLYDSFGNTVPFSNGAKLTFTGYEIKVPSNFTVKGKDTVSKDKAVFEEDETYRYIKDYCAEVPGLTTYKLFSLLENQQVEIYDNNGQKVDFAFDGNKVEITSQNGSDTLDTGAFSPLETAKKWNLFMTDDLEGSSHGYYTMLKDLVNESYLQGVARKWANGIDITFTSPHTLEKNNFFNEKIGNFVKYSDTCFSCDILLEKRMHLNSGQVVTDTMNCTFFFANVDDTQNGRDDPHWAMIDYKEISKKDGAI